MISGLGMKFGLWCIWCIIWLFRWCFILGDNDVVDGLFILGNLYVGVLIMVGFFGKYGDCWLICML